MVHDKYNINLDSYHRRDKKDGGMKMVAPSGFTGQGCQWYTETAPAGWLICDGALVDKADYPLLWELLQDTWGTSTSTQFYLPDLTQRVPVGKHSSGTFNDLNDNGGAETHTLTTAQMPAHTHKTDTESANYPSTNWSNSGVMRSRANNYTVSQPTTSTGSGNSHNILQPYRVINFIIKT